MRYLFLSVAAGGLLIAGFLGVVQARPLAAGPVPPPTPIRPPTVSLPPPTPISVPPPPPAGPVLYEMPAGQLPFDFHFVRELDGYGFKAGEHVSLTVQHVTASRTTITADSDGRFSTPIAFTWTFCGPRGQAVAPPLFIATGDRGSSGRSSEPPVPCPVLLPVYASDVAGGTVGTGNVVATVSAGPAGTAVPPMEPPDGGPHVPPMPPLPYPGFQISTPQYTIHGFGFLPGEHVTVSQRPGPFPPGPTAHATADTFGRITVTLQVKVTISCSTGYGLPMLVAQGDGGTSVISPFYPSGPMPMNCPAPVGTPIPPGIPGVTPTPASLPAPSMPPAVHTAGGATLSLRVAHTVVSPGASESVTIRTDGESALTVTIRYPGGRMVRHAVRTGSSGKRTVRWRIPASTHSGVGQVAVAEGDGISLRAPFRVR